MCRATIEVSAAKVARKAISSAINSGRGPREAAEYSRKAPISATMNRPKEAAIHIEQTRMIGPVFHRQSTPAQRTAGPLTSTAAHAPETIVSGLQPRAAPTPSHPRRIPVGTPIPAARIFPIGRVITGGSIGVVMVF
jgi:hypothetical protein